MDNQHKQIKGYRDLTQYEIDLMNRIKEHAELTRTLTTEIKNHLIMQNSQAIQDGGNEELDRLLVADPERFHDAAVTQLQTGFMLLTRSVAQPTTF